MKHKSLTFIGNQENHLSFMRWNAIIKLLQNIVCVPYCYLYLDQIHSRYQNLKVIGHSIP